jgi:hypothetical protein
MLKLCVTRFNNTTKEENENWKKLNNHSGCIYGTPIKINSTISPNENLIILEMNNSSNKIEGIGIIKNSLFNKKYKIYKDNNYNRYIYYSNKYYNTENLNNKLKNLLKILEYFLFKTKKHYKRGHGIQEIPKYLKNSKILNFTKLINEALKEIKI